MTASTLGFRFAAAMAVIGMGWGLFMGMTNDHATMPAHAHLNLLGWVSLFLIAVFYRLHPVLDRSKAAFWQVLVWIVATAVMVIGITMIYTGRDAGDPVAAMASTVVLADMIFFAWLVVQNTRTQVSSTVTAGTAAE